MLEKDWASPEDFAALFQYLWYRDFPIDEISIGAHRADWTHHIGIVVHNIANLFGFMARFETGGKTDAVLRSRDGDEIALEWEWGDVQSELNGLRSREAWHPKEVSEKTLKYAVLVTYESERESGRVLKQVEGEWWKEPRPSYPLLLVLVSFKGVKRKEFSSKRAFSSVTMFLFDKDGTKPLRSAPAFPRKVRGTRWSTDSN